MFVRALCAADIRKAAAGGLRGSRRTRDPGPHLPWGASLPTTDPKHDKSPSGRYNKKWGGGTGSGARSLAVGSADNAVSHVGFLSDDLSGEIEKRAARIVQHRPRGEVALEALAAASHAGLHPRGGPPGLVRKAPRAARVVLSVVRAEDAWECPGCAHMVPACIVIPHMRDCASLGLLGGTSAFFLRPKRATATRAAGGPGGDDYADHHAGSVPVEVSQSLFVPLIPRHVRHLHCAVGMEESYPSLWHGKGETRIVCSCGVHCRSEAHRRFHLELAVRAEALPSAPLGFATCGVVGWKPEPGEIYEGSYGPPRVCGCGRVLRTQSAFAAHVAARRSHRKKLRRRAALGAHVDVVLTAGSREVEVRGLESLRERAAEAAAEDAAAAWLAKLAAMGEKEKREEEDDDFVEIDPEEAKRVKQRREKFAKRIKPAPKAFF